jgi:hypothetical protein
VGFKISDDVMLFISKHQLHLKIILQLVVADASRCGL